MFGAALSVFRVFVVFHLLSLGLFQVLTVSWNRTRLSGLRGDLVDQKGASQVTTQSKKAEELYAPYVNDSEPTKLRFLYEHSFACDFAARIA